MRKVTQDDIRSFVEEVVKRFNPDRILLFGSHASGITNSQSDVDLLVVMNFEGRRHQKAFEIRKSVKRPFPLGLLVRRRAEVERRLRKGGRWF